MGVWLQFEGESWDGEEEGEIEEESIGRVGIYWRWVFGYSLGGESWDGEEEGEIEEESIGRVGIYWRLSMESPTKRFRRYTRR